MMQTEFFLCGWLATVAFACGSPPHTQRSAANETVPTASSPPVAPAASAVAPDDDANVWLAAHNQFRAEHCAPPLVWSAELAAHAQKWADTLGRGECSFEHSSTRFGENLAAGTVGTMDGTRAVGLWYREVSAYDFAAAQFSMKTGHFTQVVWAATTSVGCGAASCGGLDIFVCNYDPAGNVEGRFGANVRPIGQCR